VVYVRVDINDFLELPVDEPFRMGGGPFPASLSEIAPSAGFQPGDVLITKRHWGAFGGTDLEEQVRSRGVDTVLLAGISTNAGVESTLRQGTGLGYAFVTVEDACSSHDAEQHRFAITSIFPRLSHVRTVQSERLDVSVWKIVSVAVLGSLLAQLDATRHMSQLSRWPETSRPSVDATDRRTTNVC
jgi:hypothetical protein